MDFNNFMEKKYKQNIEWFTQKIEELNRRSRAVHDCNERLNFFQK